MDLNERGTVEDIVRVLYRAKGGWRTPGGIARDLKISPETVSKIVKSHPEFFIMAGDERAKFALRLGGLDAVALTARARDLYLQKPAMSA